MRYNVLDGTIYDTFRRMMRLDEKSDESTIDGLFLSDDIGIGFVDIYGYGDNIGEMRDDVSSITDDGTGDVRSTKSLSVLYLLETSDPFRRYDE